MVCWFVLKLGEANKGDCGEKNRDQIWQKNYVALEVHMTPPPPLATPTISDECEVACAVGLDVSDVSHNGP